MTRREFMKSKPIELVSYGLAYKMQEKKKDEDMWRQGFYVYKAFEVVMAHFSAGLSGKKSKAEYLKEPISFVSNENLTQEEIDNRELERMLLAEEMWAKQHKKKGLPETVIL